MYNDTITLFCRKPGGRGQGDLWIPTIIRNVNLNIDRAAIMAKHGAQSQDRAALSIRYVKENDGIYVPCGASKKKLWMPPMKWAGAEDTFTFKSGTDFDFFWQGEWDGGAVSDADYDGGFFNYMNRTCDDCFAVTSVARYSVIAHFEIMGR